MKKILPIFIFTLFAVVFLLSSCGGGEQHTHTEEIIPAVSPTCTEVGLTEGKKCSKCNEILLKQEIIPQQHTFENSYTCAICNNEIYKESQGLKYTLSDDEKYYKVTGIGECADIEIVIPFTYNGLPVKEICDQAFFECESLESIIMGDNITTIGYEAFRWCTSLFKVTIGNGVTTMKDHAFSECYLLKSITVYEKNTAYKSIGGVLYSKNGKTLILVPNGKRCTSFTIPSGVTTIGKGAFYNCTTLESIEMPSSVNTIEDGAFYDCTSLTSVYIPNSVTTIGESAFEYCSKLTIYCEASSKPSGWGNWWNCYDSWYNLDCPVEWGHTHTYTNGTCVCGKTQS